MIVVTGSAGFIGSCILAKLNELGVSDILAVDCIENEAQKKNLENKKYVRFVDKKDFLKQVESDNITDNIGCVIHMGACSSTTLQDAQHFKDNNLEYTRSLARWTLKHGIRFIYASSAATYGGGENGYKDDDETVRKCRPLNLYGQSKQDFDIWALEHNLLNKMVGLKFFNVFGPNEYHKGDMRSVVSKAYQRVVTEGKMSLFKSYHPDYKDGEQKRDFVYVKDAVDVVLYFYKNPKINGLFNVGTGKARTWNDLAHALFAAVGKKPVIEYIEMPEILKSRYQYFTQADMTKLRDSGYTKPFMALEDSVKDYVGYLKNGKYL